MTTRWQRALRAWILWAAVLLIGATHVLVAPEAYAQDPTDEELAAARQLFTDAKQLEKEGDWEGALEKLERVARVKMTPQVRYHLALCHEQLGRFVEAINGFEIAEQEARNVDNAEDVLENAPQRAEALRAKVAYVVLEVKGKVYTSKIYLDEREISLALAGSKIPVDPGSHRVEVRQGDKVTHGEDLVLGEAETHEMELEIDDPKPKPRPLPDPVPDPDPEQPKTEPETELKRLPAYIAGGVGVAALIASAVYWSLRQETVDNIAGKCEDPEALTGCDPNDRDTEETAQTYDVASKVLLGVGAASLAAGVVLFFVLAPKDGTPTTGNSSPRVSIVPALNGVVVIGSF